MLFANNQETLQAVKQFQESEGVEIDPAAGVALASLLEAAKHNLLDCDAFYPTEHHWWSMLQV